MVQFVGIMVHGFQLVFYDDCDFPWQFAYYIGAHAVLFFGLFSEFYIRTYFNQNSKKVKILMISSVIFIVYNYFGVYNLSTRCKKNQDKSLVFSITVSLESWFFTHQNFSVENS